MMAVADQQAQAAIMINGLWEKWRALPLMWTEALRAFVCMIPMIVASGMGRTSALVTLGQGAFFYSTIFLPKRIFARVVMGSLVVALGLGFYLIGGIVAPNPWVAVIFTFFVCFNLSFLTDWKVGGSLALTLVMIYTAGINAGSPEQVTKKFLLFAGVMGWSALISLLPFWKPIPPPPADVDQPVEELAEQGFRMGIGTAIALGLGYIGGFAKLGWAPSAVGNVVRYDKTLSRKRAWARFLGTVGGAVIAAVALAFISSVTAVVWIGAFFAVLNGLFKKTKLGMMPLFYTATILLLYSANDLSTGHTNIVTRVVYNLIGISVGLGVIMFPFSRVMALINPSKPQG
jgi:hypothetical protein